MLSRGKREELINAISSYLGKIYSVYLQLDNSAVVNGKIVNLKSEQVKRISLDNDAEFYFKFFDAIYRYREILKQNIAEDRLRLVNESNNAKIYIESRIKNINSIFSKIYQYIKEKKEHGSVPIIKCLNDLFGARVEVPVLKSKELRSIVEESSKKAGIKTIINNATKQGYYAIHLYFVKDNYSFRWEIQFWLTKDDKKNRDSHAKYKQAYTSWESIYKTKDLYEVLIND